MWWLLAGIAVLLVALALVIATCARVDRAWDAYQEQDE